MRHATIDMCDGRVTVSLSNARGHVKGARSEDEAHKCARATEKPCCAPLQSFNVTGVSCRLVLPAGTLVDYTRAKGVEVDESGVCTCVIAQADSRARTTFHGEEIDIMGASSEKEMLQLVDQAIVLARKWSERDDDDEEEEEEEEYGESDSGSSFWADWRNSSEDEDGPPKPKRPHVRLLDLSGIERNET
jgi:hypothetical protein